MLVGQAVPVTGQIRRTVHAFCKDVGGVGQHRMQPLETGRREELRSMENMIKLAVVDDDERTIRPGKTGSSAWVGRPKCCRAARRGCPQPGCIGARCPPTSTQNG